MNALTLRDQLFASLHQRLLKPLGYRKKGHWSLCERGELVHAIYLRASRFGSRDEAIFWIDVQVFSPAWHQRLFAPMPYTGPTEGKPSLLWESLGDMVEPSAMTQFTLASEAAARALEAPLAAAIAHRALPLLAGCADHAGVLAHWRRQPETHEGLLTLAGLLRLLGQDDAARDAIARARLLACHENQHRWLEIRERALWQDVA